MDIKIFFCSEACTFYSTETMPESAIPDPKVLVAKNKWDLIIKQLSENENLTVVANTDGSPVVVTKTSLQPLSKLKDTKRKEINKMRDELTSEKFEYNGHYYDADIASVLKITSTAIIAMGTIMNGTTNTLDISVPLPTVSDFAITWTDYDNVDVDLTATDIIRMITSLAKHATAMQERCKIIKEFIDNCTEKSQLDGITWDMDITVQYPPSN